MSNQKPVGSWSSQGTSNPPSVESTHTNTCHLCMITPSGRGRHGGLLLRLTCGRRCLPTSRLDRQRRLARIRGRIFELFRSISCRLPNGFFLAPSLLTGWGRIEPRFSDFGRWECSFFKCVCSGFCESSTRSQGHPAWIPRLPGSNKWRCFKNGSGWCGLHVAHQTPLPLFLLNRQIRAL